MFYITVNDIISLCKYVDGLGYIPKSECYLQHIIGENIAAKRRQETGQMSCKLIRLSRDTLYIGLSNKTPDKYSK